jgi:general stress protein YciG
MLMPSPRGRGTSSKLVLEPTKGLKIMPRSDYSSGDSGYGFNSRSGLSGFSISDPSDPWSGAGRAVQAKEPDRQGTARGSRRSRMEEEGYQESSGSQGQGGSSRRGSQARRVTDRSQARRTTTAEPRTGRRGKSRRGFAAMSPEQQREIARKGGLTVSRNRRHMADIGRVGGEHSHGGRRARARR